MTDSSDNPQTAQPKIAVYERSQQVTLVKSKKLAALAGKSSQSAFHQQAFSVEDDRAQGLKPEVALELKRAKKIINGRINAIMTSFPSGMKNRLFNLRFGSVEDIKAMNIKTAFKTLGIDPAQVRMRLLDELDYYGNRRP